MLARVPQDRVSWRKASSGDDAKTNWAVRWCMVCPLCRPRGRQLCFGARTRSPRSHLHGAASASTAPWALFLGELDVRGPESHFAGGLVTLTSSNDGHCGLLHVAVFLRRD